jgi:hypothetical protein
LKRAQELIERRPRGQPLSPEDRALLEVRVAELEQEYLHAVVRTRLAEGRTVH